MRRAKSISKKARILGGALVLCFVTLLVPAEETYVFERMWPTLEQPWYFFQPEDVAVDGSGNVYVVDTVNYRIQKFDSDGTFLTKWGSKGSGDGEFFGPRGLEVDWGVREDSNLRPSDYESPA